MKANNIHSGIPNNIPEELFETLINSKNIKIERIISKGHKTPKGQWYDQDWNEFVILIKGRAAILFESNSVEIFLESGDYLDIPAHKKHRVEWTDEYVETIWLAVHYK